MQGLAGHQGNGIPGVRSGVQPFGDGQEDVYKRQVNVPVLCGGVLVRPGDIVAGDCDGVVVVPREDEDEVFARALAKFEKEQHIVEQLKAGKTTLEIYGFDELIRKLESL